MTDAMLALCRLIADDAFAATFQSLGQYRSALISAAHKLSVPVESLGREHADGAE